MKRVLHRWWTALLVLLVACGGNTQVEPFRPQRLLAFGDETSVITADGKKHTVNAVTAAGAIDCASNPNWVQLLSQSFNLPFPQCNPAGSPTVSVNYAVAGAKVADLAPQIDQQFAAGGFTNRDLVTVLAGTNDIVEQYQRLAAQGEAAITATLQARAEALAAQVNRIANAGGKVLISTVPDTSFTPFALAEQTADPSIDRISLLRRVVFAFNSRLRAELINDGSMIGLVLADELVQVVARNAGFFGFVDVTQAACAVALPDCTTQTLVPNASGDTWLWASPLQLSAGGHRQLGAVADSRARNNPFQE